MKVHSKLFERLKTQIDKTNFPTNTWKQNITTLGRPIMGFYNKLQQQDSDSGFPDESVETPGGNVVPVTAGVDPVIAVPVVAGGPVDATDYWWTNACKIWRACCTTGITPRLGTVRSDWKFCCCTSEKGKGCPWFDNVKYNWFAH